MLYGNQLTVPLFVRLLPLNPNATDAATYINKNTIAVILKIHVIGELISSNAAMPSS